jgi:hypothetical protein
MRKTAIILTILLTLPMMAFAQPENDMEVSKFKLNDFYSAKLSKISEDEYTKRKEESKHLRHKPYKVVRDIDEAKKMLGKRLKVFDMKEEGTDFGLREYEITFKDGTKKRLDAEHDFIACYPQLETLLFHGGHSSDQPFDLNNSNNMITFTNDFPHHIRIGNPHYHVVSPDKQLRINGFHDGQDCVVYFLEKWNKSNKKYEAVGFFWGEIHSYLFCYATDLFWVSNNKKLFKNGFDYFEVEFIENASR